MDGYIYILSNKIQVHIPTAYSRKDMPCYTELSLSKRLTVTENTEISIEEPKFPVRAQYLGTKLA